MRVGFVLTQSRGGPVDVTVGLARALRERGTVEPLVIGPPPETSAGPIDDLWLDVRMSRKTDLPGARRIVEGARRAGCELLHAQDRRAILAVARLTRPGVPTVGTYHGVPVQCVSPTGRLGRRDSGRARLALRLDRWSLAGLTHVVTPSEDMAAYLRSEVGAPSQRISVVPNGTVKNRRPQPVTDARRFMTVGSFTPNKSVGGLVRAFAALASEDPEVELVLVGDGPERRACEATASHLGIRDRVSFLGYRDDVPALLTTTDVFVLPSREENAPLALLEAMAAGRVCVASAVGGVPEILTPGTGLLVPPGDERALTAALFELHGDPDRAASLGAAAATAAAEKHDIAELAAAYEALYVQLSSS
jgi:glycosyltransferase involved in cell wall biosynthesis